VPSLPSRPNLDHLKRQAKDLLGLYESGDRTAFDRLRASLPAARGRDDNALRQMHVRLHDAQSCIAREYGFRSWDDLRTSVLAGRTDEPHLTHRWLNLVYGVAEWSDRPHPDVAARMLQEARHTLLQNPIAACAAGDVESMRRFGLFDQTQVNRPIEWRCPECQAAFACPPLTAVTHSSLITQPQYGGVLRQACQSMLDAGADPNVRWTVATYTLSALYGAAGKNHDVELTRMLLGAGADPNDNESLYHATEAPTHEILELLLAHGARVAGSNALQHQLDREDVEGLRLLLAHTTDVNDTGTTLPSPLLWALRRRRSASHVEALLQAGANPLVTDAHGVSALLQAERYGLPEVAALLRRYGATETLSVADQFVAACARADREAAQRLLDATPGIIQTLSRVQLRQLPELAAAGEVAAVMLMVELGWPIAVTGGDWNASAVNLAVFRGDAHLTRFLLEHGASWAERHGYGDHTTGTLSWASRNLDPSAGDWVGCAKALVDHGMPIPPESERFSDEVAECFADLRKTRPQS
jgi:ankyrin repeat protein